MMEHVRVVFACHPRWDGLVAPLPLDNASTPAPLRDAPLLAWSRLVEHCLARSVDLLLLAGDFFQESAPLSDRLTHALSTGLHRLAQGPTQVAWLPSPATAHLLPQLPGNPWPLLEAPANSPLHSLVVEYHAGTRAVRCSPHAPLSSSTDAPPSHTGQRVRLQLTGLAGHSSPVPHFDWLIPATPTRPSRVTLENGPHQIVGDHLLGPLVSLHPQDPLPAGLVEVDFPLNGPALAAPTAPDQPAGFAEHRPSDEHPASPHLGTPQIRWQSESLSPLHWQTVTVDASDLATEADLQTACELALPDLSPRHLTLLHWQITIGPALLHLATQPEVADRLLAALRHVGSSNSSSASPSPGTLWPASLEWLPPR
ncbi:MAG: hypothetical protein ACKO3P_04345, partial [Planctomycetaceae bacterium]